MKNFLKLWALIVGCVLVGFGLLFLGGLLIPLLPAWVLYTVSFLSVTGTVAGILHTLSDL